MADINVRSDSVDVQQIMEQIRARIREKRGVDYTEEQIRELAAVKLEKFLDPRGVRSDLLEQFRRVQPSPERPNYAFEEQTIYESHRAPLRWIRRLLRPILKLFFNPNPLIQALHIQSQLNDRAARLESTRHERDQLSYEVIHNLVVEMTRLSIEVKNAKMRIESLTSRLEFNERRARALEGVVLYKPQADDAERVVLPDVSTDPVGGGGSHTTSPRAEEGPGQRSRRRRRRRGRRGGASAVAVMTGGDQAGVDSTERSSESGAEIESSTTTQEVGATDSAAAMPSEPADMRLPSSTAQGGATAPTGESREPSEIKPERDPDAQ